MIGLLLLAWLEAIPVAYGQDSSSMMAYLWNGDGKIVTASGGLWSTVQGDGAFQLPAGWRIKKVWRFAATDAGSCFEGDLNVTRGGVAVYLSAPHKESERGVYDAWSSTDVDVRTNADLFSVHWTCRVTCGTRARCHYGLQFLLEMR